MTLPNFFIIGAPKAGTTSLYHYLKSHPQVFLSSLKESYFFCSDKYKQPELLGEFESLFEDVAEEQAIGEACANYIFSENAGRNISHAVPHAKLILILRDPAQRAYSEYLMNYRSGSLQVESRNADIEEAFLSHLKKERSSYFYFDSIRRLLEFFGEEQIKIVLFEDLKDSPRKVVQECCDFLGVDSTLEFEISNKIYNKGGMPKNETLFLVLESLRRQFRTRLANVLPSSFYAMFRGVYSKIRSVNMQVKSPKLSPEGRKRLVDIHREDTLKLQEFIGRDLSSWLKA